MHVFPLCDFGVDEPHTPKPDCRCKPMPSISKLGGLVWLHHPFETEKDDLVEQAQAILDAESVRLWEKHERDGLKLKIIPFTDLKAIVLPKSHPRI